MVSAVASVGQIASKQDNDSSRSKRATTRWRSKHWSESRSSLSRMTLLLFSSSTVTLLALLLLPAPVVSSGIANGTDGSHPIEISLATLEALSIADSEDDDSFVNTNQIDEDEEENLVPSANRTGGSTSSKTKGRWTGSRRANVGGGRNRPVPIYLNEFAVYIPGGPDVADIIAHKYGFSNQGQSVGPCDTVGQGTRVDQETRRLDQDTAGTSHIEESASALVQNL
ncbi:uncharacterized protein LOC129753343 [Uranotaenia lowii]|uniref:uncharacterized protein LOC129753343 n=1 Tax=Uranotaenia lowii TaxID=190385 RepID=UPI0024797532|nr:uncharacterized protein LOC129753343 [Uranotaenia lowii]